MQQSNKEERDEDNLKEREDVVDQTIQEKSEQLKEKRNSEVTKSILKVNTKPKSSKVKNVKFNISSSQDSIWSNSESLNEDEEVKDESDETFLNIDFARTNINKIDTYAEHFDNWVDEIEEEHDCYNIDQEK